MSFSSDGIANQESISRDNDEDGKKNSTSAKFIRKTSSKISWIELIQDMDEEDEKDPQDGDAVTLAISKSLNRMGNNILLDSLSESERTLLGGGSSSDEDENASKSGETSAEEGKDRKEDHTRLSNIWGSVFRGSGSSKNQNEREKHTNKTSRKTASLDEDKRRTSESAVEFMKRKAKRFSGALNKGQSWGNVVASGNSPNSRTILPPSSPMKSKNAITSLAPLGDGYFLTASQSNCIIKMWKSKAGMGVQFKENVVDTKRSLNRSNSSRGGLRKKNLNPKVDFVCDFEGHSSSGIMDLKVLDKKGRFLSVGEFALRYFTKQQNMKHNA